MTYYLYIEEPDLPVAPGTDWEEVRRTRIPPHRFPPSPDVGDRACAMLVAEGWVDVELIHQGWDDHPQVGSAWWIAVQGVPPPDKGSGNARRFGPEQLGV